MTGLRRGPLFGILGAIAITVGLIIWFIIPKPPPSPLVYSVPSDGTSVTTEVLNPGVEYLVIAKGEVSVIGEGQNGYGDAEYYYSYGPYHEPIAPPWGNGFAPNILTTCPTIDVNQDKGVDMGISIDDPGDLHNAQVKEPNWGEFSDNHVYQHLVTGQGRPLTLNYHDCVTDNNNGEFTVEIIKQR